MEKSEANPLQTNAALLSLDLVNTLNKHNAPLKKAGMI